MYEVDVKNIMDRWTTARRTNRWNSFGFYLGLEKEEKNKKKTLVPLVTDLYFMCLSHFNY